MGLAWLPLCTPLKSRKMPPQVSAGSFSKGTLPANPLRSDGFSSHSDRSFHSQFHIFLPHKFVLSTLPICLNMTNRPYFPCGFDCIEANVCAFLEKGGGKILRKNLGKPGIIENYTED